MLPKILCLHGSGTNAAIFRIQAIRLGRLLQPHFELVYVDGFIDTPPGPGVLPFFEGMEPYKRWLTDFDAHDEIPWPDLEKLVEVFNSNGPFVGIIGFSQGAKAATHLIRWLEQRGQQLDFLALFAGTVPRRLDYGTERWDALIKPTIITRSIHVIGDDDEWRGESEGLMEHYDKFSRSLLRFKGAHHMPIDTATNEQLAALIIACHEEGH
ncbi:serine hydrolase FSH [Hypoxylon argillaceum]|nr:serine hydrolase FSH [Hypoxylon argillaceum]KAI1146744.1 serine hydrolase FSH [Nemania diffusa]